MSAFREGALLPKKFDSYVSAATTSLEKFVPELAPSLCDDKQILSAAPIRLRCPVAESVVDHVGERRLPAGLKDTLDVFVQQSGMVLQGEPSPRIPTICSLNEY